MSTNPTYAEELGRLSATYDSAASTAAPPMPAAPAVFVASGGSLAVAHAGAALHHRTGGGPAYVATPHELISAGSTPPLVVVVSDQLGHPDAHDAIRHGLRAGADVVVVTTRTDAVMDGARVVTCPRPGRDGYVATSSVLAMTVGLLKVYLPEQPLPPFEALAAPWLDAGSLRADRHVRANDVICAYAPVLRHVAVDVETRHGESGLGHVAVVDLRGLGHGRHVSLARHAHRAAALLVCDDESAALAARTADALAPEIERVVWRATQPWPFAAIEMLLPSFGLLATRADDAHVDPGNPPVDTSGERLFRLGLNELAEVAP